MLATTKIDGSGNYEFTDVPQGYYNLQATKRGYWPDSNPVTVNASEPKTADISLCQKDDLRLLKNVSVGVAVLE